MLFLFYMRTSHYIFYAFKAILSMSTPMRNMDSLSVAVICSKQWKPHPFKSTFAQYYRKL